MNARSLEQIRAGCVAAPPTMDRREQAVTGAEKRMRRAREKLDAAEAELDSAVLWLERMKAERAEFIAAQVDDQMRML